MKIKFLSILILLVGLISAPSFSQTENTEELLGLPGDDLDLYAVLNLFQKSKTIEDFEKSLNDEKTGIVNLDLNNDGKVDFIKVETKKDGDNFLFILQDPISEKETQDVAVMTVSKDKEGEISMQIIGDEKLYGKNYVVEPRSKPTESITANPAYVGEDPVTVNVAASTEVIVVQSAPIVQYVYSPAYVPYYPPYYYGYYPPYWRPIAVMSIAIYRHNNWHHHGGYHGGHHGGHNNVNININNRNTYNNYNKNTRNTSNTVNNNIKNGNFKTSGQGGSRTNNRATTSNNRASTSNNRASTSNRASTGNKATSANRASTSNRASTTSRPSTTNRSTSSSNRSSGRTMGTTRSASPSRSYGGRTGGGGRRR